MRKMLHLLIASVLLISFESKSQDIQKQKIKPVSKPKTILVKPAKATTIKIYKSDELAKPIYVNSSNIEYFGGIYEDKIYFNWAVESPVMSIFIVEKSYDNINFTFVDFVDDQFSMYKGKVVHVPFLYSLQPKCLENECSGTWYRVKQVYMNTPKTVKNDYKIITYPSVQLVDNKYAYYNNLIESAEAKAYQDSFKNNDGEEPSDDISNLTQKETN